MAAQPWPDAAPLRVLPADSQLPLPLDGAPAPVWERRHAAGDGGPFVVVGITRTPDGSAWRVSFGLAYPASDGGELEPIETHAIDAATYAGARLAVEAYWAALAAAGRAYHRHVGMPIAPADVAPVEPSGGRLLPFRNRGELAPTG